MGQQPGKASNDPLSYFAFAKQSAKGTEGSTFYFMKHLDGTGFEVDVDVQTEREGGDGQEIGFRYVSMVKADGALNANDRGALSGRVWAAVLGQDSIASAAVASLAKHTAVPAASLPYFTMEQRWSDEIERAPDSVFTGVTLSGEAGRPWKLSANFVSGGTIYQRDVGSTLTPTREQGKPFFYPGGSYVFDGGASYSADFTKIQVSVNRGVDDGIQTTGLGRDDIVPNNFEVNVEGTLKYTSRDFYQKVTFTGGSVVLANLATGSIDLTMIQQVQVASGFFATGIERVRLPLIEWLDAKVNKLDPDGKTVYLDVVGGSVKAATHAIIHDVDTGDNAAY